MESATLSHWSCPEGLKQTPLHRSNPIWLRPWSNGDPASILPPRPAIKWCKWCIDHFILDTGGPASPKPLISSFSTRSTLRQRANDPLILQVYQTRHTGSFESAPMNPPQTLQSVRCLPPTMRMWCYHKSTAWRVERGRGERKGGLEGKKGTTQNRRYHSPSSSVHV